MSHLSDFPHPSSNHLPTLCEKNSKLICEGANITDYKKISLVDSTSNRKSLACVEETCKPAFVTYEENLLDKIQSQWSTDGISGVFKELSDADEISRPLQTLSLHIGNGVAVLNKWWCKLFALKLKVCTNVDDSATLFACHPHIGRIAVALKDHSVKVISLNQVGLNDHEVLLKDKRIQKITCLAWRPKSSMSIAVGSSRGVLVWLLDPNATTARPGSNMSRFLHSSDMTSDVTCITWQPDGKLLACSCKNSSSFWIWDIISQRCTQIHRVGSATSLLAWSPCAQRLLSANQSDTFRVWETRNWNCEKWADLNGRCSNACWSSCGSYLLFTVANESIIYYSHFHNKKDTEAIDISGSGVASKCADVSKIILDVDAEEIGGYISNMAWDPTNSRLAVTFKGISSSSNQRYIALYHTRISPILQLVPCGFICGEEDEFPLSINFLNGFDKGALLSVYWSSGTVSCIPLLFNQTLSYSPRQNINLVQSGIINFNRTIEDIADLSTMQNETALFSVLDE